MVRNPMSFEYEMKICCCPNPRYLLQHHYNIVHTYIQKVEQLRERLSMTTITKVNCWGHTKALEAHWVLLLPKGPKSASHNNTTHSSVYSHICSHFHRSSSRCCIPFTFSHQTWIKSHSTLPFFRRLGWCPKPD